ncbi:histone-lysine N-methyltransferase TRX1-like isoform X1 [Phaseolus vulgaris]|uniref:histone-lysine N-methyltransferase TRX1-like isoform X1 n=1 Tax=Phaseolus vulgaris TaxID=3885 RepID=UPI0035CC0336
MSACGSESGKSETSEGGANESVAFGDVIFIKLRGSSWWPAQVVDENSVNKSVKPSKRSKRSPRDILVRHYGSYIYSYIDPIKCRAEFKTILEHNDGSLRKILLQTLEQAKDLPSTKSSRSKGSSLKPKGTLSKDAAGKKKSNGQDKEQNKIKHKKQKDMSNEDKDSQSHETSSLEKSPELSSRRIRVMENLGLIAPAGSPFQKSAHKYNKAS